ncbi:MAG: hypothetical protein J0L99_03700 [Chitinophagales bacterium]|nr:hypothetical protein [Chitinophagales bacterium]
MKNKIVASARSLRVLFLWAFMLAQVVAWGQNDELIASNITNGNSVPFWVNDNAGLSAPNTGLIASFDSLYAKLKPADQAQFNAYDISLYRLNKDKIQDSIRLNTFINSVKNSSLYYVILITVWENDQNLERLELKYNLPPDIPASGFYTREEITAKANNSLFSYLEQINHGQKGRIKEFQKIVVQDWVAFLFEYPKLRKLSTKIDTSEVPQARMRKDSMAGKSAGKTCVTPNHCKILLPPTAVLAKFVTCEPENTVPLGSLVWFYDTQTDLVYYGWYLPGANRLLFYAPQTSDGNPVYSLKYEPPTAGHDTTAVETAFNIDVNKNQFFKGVVGYNPTFTNNSLHVIDPKNINFLSLTANGPVVNSLDDCLAKNLPQFVENGDPNDIIWKLPVIQSDKYNGDILSDIQGANFKDIKLYDYTGGSKAINQDFENRILNAFGTGYGNCDIIFTNTETSIFELYRIRGLKPYRRNVLWIHFDTAQKRFRYEILAKNDENELLVAEQNKEYNKAIQEFMRSLKWNGGQNALTSLYDLYKLVGQMSTLISMGYQQLIIPEKYYDCDNPNYVLKGLNFDISLTPQYEDCIPTEFIVDLFSGDLQTTEGVVPAVSPMLFPEININPSVDDQASLVVFRASTAFSAGLWNGIVEQASSGADLMSLLTQSRLFLNPVRYWEEAEDIKSFAKVFHNDTLYRELVKQVDDELYKIFVKGNDPQHTLFYYYRGKLITFIPDIIEGAPAAAKLVSKAGRFFKTAANVIKALKVNKTLLPFSASIMRRGGEVLEEASGVLKYKYKGRTIAEVNLATGEITPALPSPKINLETFVPEEATPITDLSGNQKYKLYYGKNVDGEYEYFIGSTNLTGERIASKYNATNATASPFHYNPNVVDNKVKRVVENGSDPARLLDDNIKNKIDELPEDAKKDLMDDLGKKTEKKTTYEVDENPPASDPIPEEDLEILGDPDLTGVEIVSPPGALRGLAGDQHRLTQDHIDTWELLHKNSPVKGVCESFESLDAFVRIQRSPNWGRIEELGFNRQLLSRLIGHEGASYEHIVDDIARFADVLVEKSVIIGPDANFQRIVNNLASRNKYQRQGAHSVLREFIQNPDFYKNSVVRFEHGTPTTRGTTAFVDIRVAKDNGVVFVERKWYKKNKISRVTFEKEFVERDLFSAPGLFNIRWSIEGTKLDLATFTNYINSTRSRAALETMHNSGRLDALVVEVDINSVDDFINYLIKPDIFAKIFP